MFFRANKRKSSAAQPLQKIADVLIVDIEGPAVDVGTLSQLADGDGFGGLLRHEIHQCLPQLPLCLSDAPVNTSLFHTNTLRTLFDLPNS